MSTYTVVVGLCACVMIYGASIFYVDGDTLDCLIPQNGGKDTENHDTAFVSGLEKRRRGDINFFLGWSNIFHATGNADTEVYCMNFSLLVTSCVTISVYYF